MPPHRSGVNLQVSCPWSASAPRGFRPEETAPKNVRPVCIDHCGPAAPVPAVHRVGVPAGASLLPARGALGLDFGDDLGGDEGFLLGAPLRALNLRLRQHAGE